MKNEKIQTGLRIPADKYAELDALAAEIGTSLNALILMLVDLGLALRSGRFILHREEEQGR